MDLVDLLDLLDLLELVDLLDLVDLMDLLIDFMDLGTNKWFKIDPKSFSRSGLTAAPTLFCSICGGKHSLFIVECKNILSMKIRILLQKGFQPIVFRLPASQPKKYTWMSIFFIHVQASQRIYITNTVGHSIKYLYITWKTWLKSQVLCIFSKEIFIFLYILTIRVN